MTDEMIPDGSVPTPSYFALDFRGMASSELAKSLASAMRLLEDGLPASEARFFVAVVALLRQELRRRADGDDGGAVQVITDLPGDAIAAAQRIQDELRADP